MNKKVFISMTTLIIIFLIAIYILKIFFPLEFVLSIENKNIIKIGNFINNSKTLSIIFYFIIGFIFDWLYFGAVCKTKIHKLSLIIIMICYGLLFSVFSVFVPIEKAIKYNGLIIALQNCYMIFIPMFYTKTIRELSITYSINAISQNLLLLIRDVSLYSANTNSLVTFMLSIDNYLWILLLFIIFNFNKKQED